MSNEVQICIVGNLTADPEMRTTSNGGTVANLTIASTPRQFDRNSGQWEDGETLFMRCSAWDTQYHPTASNIQTSLSKGMRVIARGRLEQRSYQDRDGNKRTIVEMRLDEIGPALTRNTAQVTRNGNGQQQAPQQSQQWGSGSRQWGGQQAQAPASQPQDPWGGAGDDDPVF